MGFMKLVIMIIFLTLATANSLRVENKMVADIIQSYERPTTVLANVCWTNLEKRQLVAQLMKTKATTIAFKTDLKEINKFNAKDTIIFTDMICNHSEKFLLQANDKGLFKSPYRWLIIDNTNKYETSTVFTKLRVLVDSEMIIAEEKNNSTFILNLIYRIDSKSNFRKESFGVWTPTEGFKQSESVVMTSMTIRRKDLEGKNIGISYVITDNSTKTTILGLKDLKIDNVSKSTHHIMLPLYYFMNATRVMHFTDTWGYYVNNTWDGIIGDIVQGKAELSGTLSFMTVERATVMQFLIQPTPLNAKFVFREPSLSLQNNLYVLPFRGTVWGCVGVLVILLILIVYINAKWEEDKYKGMNISSTTLIPKVSEIGLFVISAITQQGSINDLKGSLGRMVTFLMFSVFVFLYTSYSANIVALLQSSSKQIKTLSDLLNSKFELGVEDQKYNRYYFLTSTEPIQKAIYENKIAKVGYKPNFMSLEEGVKRMRNKDSPFAFHMNIGMGYKVVEELFLEHEKCGLHEISFYANSFPWTYSKKGSPYSEIYKIGLSRTKEHGLADRVNRIFYKRKPACTSSGANFASVNMVDLYPILLWMLYGMLVAGAILVMEILVHRWSTKIEV